MSKVIVVDSQHHVNKTFIQADNISHIYYKPIPFVYPAWLATGKRESILIHRLRRPVCCSLLPSLSPSARATIAAILFQIPASISTTGRGFNPDNKILDLPA
ncbi:MAG: hypothetical protein U1F76_29520 [Candidatus Competibacteraceae bacterium]